MWDHEISLQKNKTYFNLWLLNVVVFWSSRKFPFRWDTCWANSFKKHKFQFQTFPAKPNFVKICQRIYAVVVLFHGSNLMDFNDFLMSTESSFSIISSESWPISTWTNRLSFLSQYRSTSLAIVSLNHRQFYSFCENNRQIVSRCSIWKMSSLLNSML